MIRSLFRPVSHVWAVLVSPESPRQIGMGFAMGMMVGMLPKGNLTAAVLTMLLLGTHASKRAGLCAMAAFSWIAVSTDAIAHRIGYWMLSEQTLQQVWSWLFQWPVVPWTALNNTVVLGSLMIGFYLFLPTYWSAKRAAETFQPATRRWMQRRKAAQWVDAKVASTGKV